MHKNGVYLQQPIQVYSYISTFLRTLLVSILSSEEVHVSIFVSTEDMTSV